LLDILTALPCMVMISGYWSRLYAKRLRDWHSVRFQVMTHGGPRTEWLWSNFPEPVALHDYRDTLVGASASASGSSAKSRDGRAGCTACRCWSGKRCWRQLTKHGGSTRQKRR
jgi:hypothetical protein